LVYADGGYPPTFILYPTHHRPDIDPTIAPLSMDAQVDGQTIPASMVNACAHRYRMTIDDPSRFDIYVNH
jgi:hypothetical protein